ncbi:MAG: hypothetical protein WBI27_19445, partial [Thermoanaerobaculia bacterium]
EVPCIGWLPESDLIRDCDIDGRSVLELADTSPIDDSVTQCMEHLGILVRVDSETGGFDDKGARRESPTRGARKSDQGGVLRRSELSV